MQLLQLADSYDGRSTVTGSRLVPLLLRFLSVYEAVLATLAGSHLLPVDGLRCGLDDRWRQLYRRKDALSIRKIQDTFSCCGLHSLRDMAWPFPEKHVAANMCQETYRRTRSCFAAWQGQERKAALLILVAVVMVFLWEVSSVYLLCVPCW